MDEKIWQQEIIHIIGYDIKATDDVAFKNRLAVIINELINKDFDRLVGILYRLDVNEQKLKELLAQNQLSDAGLIIAESIIERQKQKMASRKKFSGSATDIPEDEKW